MKFSTTKILEIPVTCASVDSLVDNAISAIRAEGGEQIVFSCVNPHSIVESYANKLFFDALNNAEHLVADGIGAYLALRLSGDYETPRITGSDYFTKLMSALDSRGVKTKIAFFGSSEPVLNSIRKRFLRDYKNLEIAIMISPPFGNWGDAENQEMVDQLNTAMPDVIWVGMTAPKQECWSYRNRERLNAKFIGNIGAVFEFYAGTKPRAPEWACKFGVEWVYRWLQEPRRMWRRNLVSTPLFLWRFVTSLIFGPQSPKQA